MEGAKFNIITDWEGKAIVSMRIEEAKVRRVRSKPLEKDIEQIDKCDFKFLRGGS